MKTIIKKRLSKAWRMVFALAGFMQLSATAQAQQPCSLTNTIGINTGYNYATSTKLANGVNDPNWQVVALSSYCQGLTASVPPYSAMVPTTNLWTLSSTNSNWISFLPAGYYYTTGSEPVGSMWMTLRRTFRTCLTDDLKFAIQIANDNYCTSITVDGTPVPVSAPFSQTAGTTISNYTSYTTIPAFSMSLAAGTHYIDVTIHNYPQGNNNPHGLNILGQISSNSGASSLVGPLSDAKCSCVTSAGCSDTCYWKVQGNNILNGNNIFGTLTRDNVRIQTTSTDRGVMTADGLLGWNTMFPKAYLDVNCSGNNPDDGSGGSDVRFENLEPGTGFILVIDDAGFVYNSRITPADLKGMKAANDQLQGEVRMLQSRIDALTAGNNTTGVKTDVAANGSKLLQNTPNPFSGETKIEYYVAAINNSAYIMVYDLNGKELKRMPVTTAGKGFVTINGESLQSGMYIYSLIIDGQAIDSKRMTLIK